MDAQSVLIAFSSLSVSSGFIQEEWSNFLANASPIISKEMGRKNLLGQDIGDLYVNEKSTGMNTSRTCPYPPAPSFRLCTSVMSPSIVNPKLFDSIVNKNRKTMRAANLEVGGRGDFRANGSSVL